MNNPRHTFPTRRMGLVAAQPTEHEARANAQAASIAAREVYAYWVRTGSAEHLASYEAWRAGTRSWPWPDSAIAADTAADEAVRGLCRWLA